MNVALLILFICVSYLIVRIGSIALEMTGMEKTRARFQALSAFSGTGFTTSEAESVVNHPRRRKIVSYLMILGNAGIVSVIATFILTLRSSGFIQPSVNLLIMTTSLFVLYRIASHQKFARKLTEKISETIRDKLHFERPQIQELLKQSDGYGVATVVVGKESREVGLSLSQSGFKHQDIMVISIERDDRIIHVPKAKEIIQVNDRLICYGNLTNLHAMVMPFSENKDADVGKKPS